MMTPQEAGMRRLNKRNHGDSVTIKVDGKTFSVAYEWAAADDSVGQEAHAEIGDIVIGDDLEPIPSWMISRECHLRIAHAVNAAHREKLAYLSRREEREELEP